MKPESACACVVAIMGSGRSGSTLLEFLLAGHLDGARALGELETLSIRGVRDNEMCSCTRRAADCLEWRDLLARLAKDPGRERWEASVEDRRCRLPWAIGVWFAAVGYRLTGRRAADAPRRRDHYAPVLGVLSELATVQGPLIDNSKTPLHFFALASTGRVDLRVVHLVRRPQAVVWSWKRRKHLPESGTLNWYMEPKSALVSGGRWVFDQVMAASFRLIHPEHPYVRVSYDELCADPRATLARCAAVLHLPPAAVPGRPGSYHVLGGNPARFDGFSRIEPDNEWQSSLPRRIRVGLAMTASPVYRLLLQREGRRR
jgi:hypothetical protein